MGRRVMAEFLSGDKSYNFLLDRNVEHLAPLFPKKRVKTASQVRLAPAAPDNEIVAKAWRRQSIIVTADIRDFRPAMTQFQKHQGGKWCGCLFGLVVLPNVHETQKRLLKNRLSDLEAQLPRVDGKQTTWKRVHLLNYMIRVKKSGSPLIIQLGLCSICTKDTEGK